MSIIRPFTPEVDAYAALLLDAGFTVYLPADERQGVTWFHYSREVDGQVCYGTYQGAQRSFEPSDHSMPITPSRLNGSSAHVGAKWGDDATLGLDDIPVESVRMAEIIARPTNWCPFNAEPTPEALLAEQRAYFRHRGTPQRFYRGAQLANAEPWGIGTLYLPATI